MNFGAKISILSEKDLMFAKFSFQRVERIRINNEPGNVSRQLGGSWNVWRFDSAFLHH